MSISLRSQVVNMYLKGYKLNSIVDYVYKYLNKNKSHRQIVDSAFNIGSNGYSREYCERCVIDTIVEYNNDRIYIV